MYEGDFIEGRRQTWRREGTAGSDADEVKGVREGKGRFIAKDRKNTRNYEYSGQWKDNRRHGLGRCYYYNGDLYEGQWQRGIRHGKGTFFSASGERYVGLWEGDKKHG